MTLGPDGENDIDELIAEYFSAFDRVTPPSVESLRDLYRLPTKEPKQQVSAGWSRAGLLLATAAVALVLVGLVPSVLNLTQNKIGPANNSTRPGGGESLNRSLPDDLDSPQASRPVVEVTAVAAGGGPDEPSTTSTMSSTVSDGAEPQLPPPASQTTLAPQSTSESTSIAAAATPTPTTEAKLASPTTASSGNEEFRTSSSMHGNTITVRGVLAEVHTDCVSRRTLSTDGTIESHPALCNAGSWIIIDGIVYQTASSPDETKQFDRHPEGLVPGMVVSVVARRVAKQGTRYVVSCADCRVVVQSNP